MDREVRECATDSNLRKYPSKFLKMCQNAVLNNENLEADFRLLVASLVNSECATDVELLNGLFHGLISYLYLFTNLLSFGTPHIDNTDFFLLNARHKCWW